MDRDLTKAERMRAAVIGTSALATAAAGIALTPRGSGSGFAVGAWIVMTSLVAGALWAAIGQRARADQRAALLIRLLGAASAATLAMLGLTVVSEPGSLILVALGALIGALGAVAVHRDLPRHRAMAILDTA